MSEFVEFAVQSPGRFAALQRVFTELKRDKDADDWRETAEFLPYFDADSLSHFHWPAAAERLQRLADLRTRPILITPTEHTVGKSWDFESLIHAFVNGEYELQSCEMTDSNSARLAFLAVAYPYGGVGCMVALIEAFGFRVTGIDDGTGFRSFVNPKT